jgi:uncharacterized protein (TIGR03437 family)
MALSKSNAIIRCPTITDLKTTLRSAFPALKSVFLFLSPRAGRAYGVRTAQHSKERSSMKFHPRSARATFGVILLALCATVILFIAIPRVSARFAGNASHPKKRSIEKRLQKIRAAKAKRLQRAGDQATGKNGPAVALRNEIGALVDGLQNKSISGATRDRSEKSFVTFDEPREATAYFVKKRMPEGEKELPVEKYFEAATRMRGMDLFSSALDRPVTGKNHSAAPLNQQAAAANWTSLGPGNIGGRTRAILIHPSDPNIIYAAGVSGGIWKSTNGGQAWTPLGDALATLAVSSMTFEPGNPNAIYVGTGEGVILAEEDTIGDFRGAGIFKTTDAGANWVRLSATATSDFFYVNDIVVSTKDKNRIYAGTRTGVWRSTDGGASWAKVLDPKNTDDETVAGGCLDLAIRADADTDTVIASCGTFETATVYRNPDAGGAGTWKAVLTEEGMGRTSLAIAPSNQSIMYALASSIDFGDYLYGLYAVFRSTNGGETWTATVRNTDVTKLNTLLLSNPIIATLGDCQLDYRSELFSQGWYDNVIAVDPVDPNRVWAGGIDLFRSDDGGANWGVASYWWVDEPGEPKKIPQYSHADQHAIIFHPQYNGASNQIVFVGGDGGIFKTENARAATATGQTATCKPSNSAVRWRSLNNGYGVTQFYHGRIAPNGKSYFGGTQDNGTLFGTDDKGPNAWFSIVGGDGGYGAFDAVTPSTLFASYTGLSFVKSTDMGTTFGDATGGLSDDALFIAPMAIDPSDPRRLWTGGNYVWRTTNGAARWLRASGLTAGASQVSALAVAPTDSNRVLVGMPDGYIHRQANALSSDVTVRWPFIRPRNGWVSSLTFDPVNRDIAYATYSTFGGTHVWRTVDGGQTWNGIDGTDAGKLPDIPVHALAIDPSNTDRLYIGTDLGVFVSTNGGASWAVENTGFPGVITETLQMHVSNGTTQLYAFTHGRGAWRVMVNNSGCSYGISPATANVSATASNGTINITAEPGGCNWRAVSNAAWLTVSGSDSTNGTAAFNVEANPGFSSRAATATIAGRSFTVIQPGQADIASPEVAITDPAGSPNGVNATGFISLGGTAKDNNVVQQVTWETNRGASGVATYSAAQNRWAAANVPLGQGRNTITITARDAAGNLGRASIIVTSTPEWTISTVIGNGINGSSGDGGQASQALLSRAIRVAIDGAGNLYFTDIDNHTIRRITPAGIVSLVAGKTGQSGFSGDGGPARDALLFGPVAVAVDAAGNVYINDGGNRRIRKITIATGVISTIAGNGLAGFAGDGGPAIEARLNTPQGIAVDKDGNVYIADAANNRIRRVATADGKISTIAGTGVAGNAGDDGPATSAQLNQPLDVTTDKDGNVIICDSSNNRIRKVTIADGKISALVGVGGAPNFDGDGGAALSAKLYTPIGPVFDSGGNLYFSDRSNLRVRRVDAATGRIATIAGNGDLPEIGADLNAVGDGLNALYASLSFPTGLAADAVGNIYIGDRDNRRIRKLTRGIASDTTAPTITIMTPTVSPMFSTISGTVDLSGMAADNTGVVFIRWSNDRGGSGLALGTTAWLIRDATLQNGLNNLTVTAWDAGGNATSARLAVTFNANRIIMNYAGEGLRGDTGDGGAAVGARLSPIGLAVAGSSVYIADDEAHRVRRVNSAGIISAFAGNGSLGSSGDGGPAVNAAMNVPTDIVVDAAGNVYVSDTNNNRVRRIAPDGKISTYAGTGVADYNGDNQPATQAQLASPTGLALDAAGNLYIADSDNRRVRKVTASTGIISTVAGTGLVGFAGDNGTAAQAEFMLPYGLAVDRNGVLYILDRVDHRIRRVSTDGIITTVAGTGQDGYNGDNRPAKDAQINFGAFMTTDAENNLYFADTLNNRIRKITFSTGLISSVIGSDEGNTGDGGDPAAAKISLPFDVAFDSAGDIYIADFGNFRVRKVRAVNGTRTVASVSAASFLGAAIAPESVVAGFGTNLSSMILSATSAPLPTSLNATSVRVQDAKGIERLAPLFFVAPSQVNFHVPIGTAPGTATVMITGTDGSTSTGLMPVEAVAPGVFTSNANGQGVPAGVVLRVRGDGTQVFENLAQFDQAGNRFVPALIDFGPETDQLFLIFFGTGWRFRTAEANVRVTISGAEVPLLYAGLSPSLIGVDQINTLLPRSLAGKGEVDLGVVADGKATNTVRIAFK